MNKDFSELIEYLDKKFQETAKQKDVDARFKEVAKQKDVDARFEKLIDIFPTKKEVVTKQDFEELKQDFRNLQTSVDAYAKKADTYFQEMVMLSRKVDRMEKWIHQIAGKVGIELSS